MNYKDLIPTEENPNPVLKLKGAERNRFALRTFIITVMTIVVFYVIPNLFWLEVLTTKTSLFFLEVFGFRPRFFMYEENLNELPAIDLLFYQAGDTVRATWPAISIESTAIPNHYLIIKACTGLQAGTLLVGAIWATPAETPKKIKASYITLIALFIGNTLRIASMIAITTILTADFGLPYEPSWHFAHDVMGRPLGFFGTIGFVALIERQGVRILDTITTWIDAVFDLLDRILNFFNKNS